MKKLNTIICVLILFVLTISCVLNSKSIVVADENNIVSNGVKSAVLIESESGDILFEKNLDARLPVASMVKLMTILLTCEEIQNGKLSLDTKILTTENASKMGGSQVFIDPYVEYTCGDLLKSVIVASANDASVALAEFISGSEEQFVIKMNERAKNLGLKNTLYANCTGLPAPEQYSCAIDCATLLKNLMKYDEYKEYSNIWMDQLIHPSGRKTELVNTNKLIKYYTGCDCGKTGSTNEAGYCLTASAEKNNMRLISVVIGASNGQERFKQSSMLLNYGFANFCNKQLVNKNSKLDTIEVTMAKQKNIDIFAKEDFFVVDKKGNNGNYSCDLKLNDQIIAPIAQNQSIGKLIITKNGKVIKEIDIVTNCDVNKITYFDNIKKFAENW